MSNISESYVNVQSPQSVAIPHMEVIEPGSAQKARAKAEIESVIEADRRQTIARKFCTQCWQSKTKCDMTRPACLRCQKKGMSCHYSESGRERHGPTTMINRYLSEQLSRMIDKDQNLPSHNQEAMSIHDLYHYTLQLLAKLTTSNQYSLGCSRGVQLSLKRYLGLLYMWAQGIDLKFFENGVDRDTGLQATVVRELATMMELILGHSDASDHHPEQDSARNRVTALRDHYNHVTTESKEDSDGSTSSNTDEESDHKIFSHDEEVHLKHKRLIQQLEMHLQCLMDLLPTLEHCCDEEKSKSMLDAVAPRNHGEGVAETIRPYVMQVQDKFTSIDAALARRLGEANWSRFQRLQALSMQILKSSEDSEESDDAEHEFQEIQAPTFHPVSQFHDSGLGASMPAKSQYNASVASHTSFLSTQSAANRGSVRVPATPAEVEQRLPFICTICGLTLSHIRNRIDWKLHIFADIQPYICTSGECLKMKATFSTRTEWADHEFDEHRSQTVWRCFQCSANANTEHELCNHLENEHAYPVSTSSKETATVIQAAKTIVTNIADQVCPMCLKGNFADRRDWTTHVGRHMEEIALIVLPRLDSDDEDNEQNSVSSLASKTVLPLSEISKDSVAADTLDDPTEAHQERSSIQSFSIVPSLDGFRAHARQLNPRLVTYLAERVAQDQLRRYKRLGKNKGDHARLVWSEQKCPSNEYCADRGGPLLIITRTLSPGNPSVDSIQYEIGEDSDSPRRSSRKDSGKDDSKFADSTVVPALFPPGIPLPPVSHLPANFECPLCFKVKTFQKPSEWTKHVHEDIQPFTCTFPNCSEPKTFKRKTDWIRHENERHRRLEWWKCNIEECSHICYRKVNFIQHLVREHKMTEPRHHIWKQTPSMSGLREKRDNGFWELVNSCHVETSQSPRNEPCQFCGNTCSTWKKLSLHKSKHMEQIAMPVLDLVAARWNTASKPISSTDALDPSYRSPTAEPWTYAQDLLGNQVAALDPSYQSLTAEPRTYAQVLSKNQVASKLSDADASRLAASSNRYESE